MPDRPRLIRNLLVAAGVAIASTIGVSLAWRAIDGGDLSLHGWIALTLGISGTVALAWGLMALAFKSHREGWDDRADTPPEPGGDDDKT